MVFVCGQRWPFQGKPMYAAFVHLVLLNWYRSMRASSVISLRELQLLHPRPLSLLFLTLWTLPSLSLRRSSRSTVSLTLRGGVYFYTFGTLFIVFIGFLVLLPLMSSGLLLSLLRFWVTCMYIWLNISLSNFWAKFQFFGTQNHRPCRWWSQRRHRKLYILTKFTA